MDKVHFYKMHGAGNDFILLDNRAGIFKGNETALFRRWCQRHLGVGADGLMLLEEAPGVDFRVVYLNSDGRSAEMCGNGARCAVALAHRIGLCGDEAVFLVGKTHYRAQKKTETDIKLWMPPPKDIRGADALKLDLPPEFSRPFFVNSGVPHLVLLYQGELNDLNVAEWGNRLRRHPQFQPAGTNVNFLCVLDAGRVRARVYERGVEQETLACGTGAVACGIYLNRVFNRPSPVRVEYPGGTLEVEFNSDFSELSLSGPVVFVFEGELPLPPKD